MKNVMICLEKMDIGGVETSVLNQALEYKRRGIRPIILAKEGVYNKNLQENDIIFENFEFELKNNIDMERATKIMQIMQKYDIDYVIINQYPCLLSVIPACIIRKIPYAVYFHTVSGYRKEDNTNVFNWYENTFSIYKDLFKISFDNANKVIAISEGGKNYLSKRYDIPKEKIEVLYNSINLDYYTSQNKENKKQNWVLVSRLALEKMTSIKNSIDVFENFDMQGKNLKIVGDGPERENIEQYVQSKKCKDKIEFLGASNDVMKIVEKSDVVCGVGRVILEALAMKKIAVLVSNQEPKQIITINNIKNEAEEGFCGLDLEPKSCEDLAKKIQETEINVEENYNFVKENLDIKNNILIPNSSKVDYENANIEIWNLIQKLQNTIDTNENKIEEVALLKNELDKAKYEIEEYKNKYNGEKKEKEKIFEELQNVYNSKRFKIVNKMANIIRKK